MAAFPRPFHSALGVARIVAAGAFAAALGVGETRAAADPTDVLQLTLTTAWLKDNNLFRIPDGDPSLFGVDPGKKSDTLQQLGVQLKFDKTVSRQHFIAEANYDQNNYQKNDNIDHIAHDNSAKWLWEIGNPWNGEVSYRNSRYLSGFADINARIVNLVTVETFAFEGAYRPHPRWRLWGGAKELKTSNSAPSQVRVNVDITTVLLGVDYRTPSENKAGIQLRLADGHYPDRVPVPGDPFSNDFKDTEPSVVWSWQTSGKTRFNGRLGYLDRRHEELPARDFSGLTGRANVDWEATGKLQIKAAGWRELRTYETQTSSYLVATGVELVPTWAVTSKISLLATASYETRDYLGDPGIVLVGLPARKDDLRVLRLAGVYTPLRNAEISLVLEKSSRDSNRLFNKFNDETAFLSLKLGF